MLESERAGVVRGPTRDRQHQLLEVVVDNRTGRTFLQDADPSMDPREPRCQMGVGMFLSNDGYQYWDLFSFLKFSFHLITSNLWIYV
jgi:hypothetical protein